MNFKKLWAYFSITLVVIVVAVPAAAQQNKVKPSGTYEGVDNQAQTAGRTTLYADYLPEVNAAASTNWSLHNLDLRGSRFAAIDQINTSNVKSLAPRWLFQPGASNIISESTAIVVDGVMYATDPFGSVYALDAVTGDKLWKFNVGNLIPAGDLSIIAQRGAVYGDGAVYVAAGPSLFGIDAKTGGPLQGFGQAGRVDVLAKVLKAKFPELQRPADIGYSYTAAPQFYKGNVFVVVQGSERHCPGGLVTAVNAKTGDIVWNFNDIPQGPEDEGWTIAGPTWVGGARNGGGVWETPSIDTELGMIYIPAANPSPQVDGSARKGVNLFTDCIVALDVATGKLKWYYQQVHHDVWDYDTASPPILFDMQIAGKTVKAVAQAQKNGYLYILDRRTGQPIHPIVETPVSTVTDVPGEQIWPTQPFPYKPGGQPMEPFVPLFATNVPAELASLITPYYTPPSVKDSIHLPPNIGAANFAPCSYSPQTGLIYVTAINQAVIYRSVPVGNTLKPGQPSNQKFPRPVGPERGTLTAYDPVTAELVWQAELPGNAQAGSAATAGNLVFVGDSSGLFHAYDARTGKELWKFQTGAYVKSSSLVYMVNGKEFVSVSTGSTILTFALPD